jgi:hypothetical protein
MTRSLRRIGVVLMSETIKIGPEYLDKMAEALSKYPQQNPSSLVVDNRPRKDIIHFKTFINDEGEEDEYDYDQNFEHDVELDLQQIGVIICALDEQYDSTFQKIVVDPIMRNLMEIVTREGGHMPFIEWVDPLTIVADEEETEEDTCEECGVVLEEDRASQDLCDSCLQSVGS